MEDKHKEVPAGKRARAAAIDWLLAKNAGLPPAGGASTEVLPFMEAGLVVAE